GGLRVGEHHLHVVAEQVVPALDVLRGALADQETDGAVVGRAVVGELGGPVCVQQLALGQDVHVRHLVEGHHVDLLALDDVLGLLGSAGERLVDLWLLAGGGLPVFDEFRVDFGEQFAGHVVGGVEQRRGLRLGGRAEQAGGQGGGQQEFLEHRDHPSRKRNRGPGAAVWVGILRDSYML